MDEAELRAGAHDLLLLEMLALLPPPFLDQLEANIRAGLPAMDDDEKAMRLHALTLVDDARRRFDEFTTGVWYPGR
jgi:hypothetical protein